MDYSPDHTDCLQPHPSPDSPQLRLDQPTLSTSTLSTTEHDSDPEYSSINRSTSLNLDFNSSPLSPYDPTTPLPPSSSITSNVSPAVLHNSSRSPLPSPSLESHGPSLHSIFQSPSSSVAPNPSSQVLPQVEPLSTKLPLLSQKHEAGGVTGETASMMDWSGGEEWRQGSSKDVNEEGEEEDSGGEDHERLPDPISKGKGKGKGKAKASGKGSRKRRKTGGNEELGKKMREGGEGEFWRKNEMTREEYESTPGYRHATGVRWAELLESSSGTADPAKIRNFIRKHLETAANPDSTRLPTPDHEEEKESYQRIVESMNRARLKNDAFIERISVRGAATTELGNYATWTKDDKTVSLWVRNEAVGQPQHSGSEWRDFNLVKAHNNESQSSSPFLPSSMAGVDLDLAKKFHKLAQEHHKNFLLPRLVPPTNHGHHVIAYGYRQALELEEVLSTLPREAAEKLGRKVRILRNYVELPFDEYVKEDKVIKGGIKMVEILFVEDLETGEYLSMASKTSHPSRHIRHDYQAFGDAYESDHILAFAGSSIDLSNRSSPSSTSSAPLPSSSPVVTSSISSASPSATPPPPTITLPDPSNPSSSLHIAIPAPSLPPPASSIPLDDIVEHDHRTTRQAKPGLFFSVPSDSVFAEFTKRTRGSRVCATSNASGDGAMNVMSIKGDDGKSICYEMIRERMLLKKVELNYTEKWNAPEAESETVPGQDSAPKPVIKGNGYQGAVELRATTSLKKKLASLSHTSTNFQTLPSVTSLLSIPAFPSQLSPLPRLTKSIVPFEASLIPSRHLVAPNSALPSIASLFSVPTLSSRVSPLPRPSKRKVLSSRPSGPTSHTRPTRPARPLVGPNQVPPLVRRNPFDNSPTPALFRPNPFLPPPDPALFSPNPFAAILTPIPPQQFVPFVPNPSIPQVCPIPSTSSSTHLASSLPSEQANLDPVGAAQLNSSKVTIDSQDFSSTTAPTLSLSSTSSGKTTKRFKCGHCEKDYSEMRTLNQHHRKIHPSQPAPTVALSAVSVSVAIALPKPFKCNFADCDKSYDTAASLQRHARKHAGVKPFACGALNCNLSFTDKDDVYKHHRGRGRPCFQFLKDSGYAIAKGNIVFDVYGKLVHGSEVEKMLARL
ncbi:hypothetical protein JCM5353_005813 [Sporobolomyces roseus]